MTQTLSEDRCAHGTRCPDCRMCQGCSQARCRLCRLTKKAANGPKLSQKEQIELYNRLNPHLSTTEK